MKTCSRCGETKPLSEFSKDARKTSGYKSWCKSCAATRNREFYANNPDANRKAQLKAKYKLSPQDYEDLLCLCDAKCMICGMTASEHKQTQGGFLCVDHDHNTGKVRGLLCRDCNTVLGKMKDDPELLIKAAQYLTDKN